MATQERECVALGPGAASERPFEKPRVTALAREERLDPWRADDGLLRQRGGRDERVVARIDQETRPSDPGQVGPAAATRPVVVLVDEAVERRRHEAVVLGKGARPERGLHVHAAVVEMGLGPDLGLQAAQEL